MHYIPRPIKFKAWDKKRKLLIRLDTIDFIRGEMLEKDHYLLQFTGLTDIDGIEIYEQDVLLIGHVKYIVFWNEKQCGWYFSKSDEIENPHILLQENAIQMKRFCSFFELE